MKITLPTAILVGVVLASSVFSETAEPSRKYIGVKGGPMTISRDIPFNNDGVMLGVVFGYDVPDNNWAVEGEFSTTVSKASSSNDRYSDLGVSVLAGYGVYRTPGRVYVKGKLGILYEYLTSSVSGVGIVVDVDGPGLAISYGIGGGWRVNDRLSAEIEYTSIEADIGYASLSLNWVY